jgi:phosphoserine phosphatase RsbX
MEAMTTELHREHGIEWCVVSRAVPGENVSGDLHIVVPARDGLLVGVVDGLGHGDEATAAAQKAVAVLSAHCDEPVVALIRRCHEALRTTRGAAMTILALNPSDRTAAVVGVGNVEMVLVRADLAARPARESALLRNGVVGYRLPPLQAGVLDVAPGDVVVFATDGVREDFGDGVTTTEALPRLVDRILAQKFRGTDDALVLACKVLPDDA